MAGEIASEALGWLRSGFWQEGVGLPSRRAKRPSWAILQRVDIMNGGTYGASRERKRTVALLFLFTVILPITKPDAKAGSAMPERNSGSLPFCRQNAGLNSGIL